MAQVFSTDDPKARRGPSDTVRVVYGISPDEQEGCFGNATLQGAGPLGFSVSTYITLPPGVRTNQRRAALYLGRICDRMAKAAARNGCTVTFEIQIGREDSDD